VAYQLSIGTKLGELERRNISPNRRVISPNR